MVIDADVKAIAREFGIDAGLIQAVVTAEGNILKAVQCGVPSITTREQAIRITCRSAVHAFSDFVKLGNAGSFVDYWGSRWAPLGVDNDPTNLNANWAKNVRRLWLFSSSSSKVDVGSDVPGGGAS